MAQTLNNEELTRYLGALSEAQNDKMDRNGNNASAPCAGIVQALKEAGCSVVIESWIDPEKPTDGYRIWSDGYCEQWGRTLISGADTNNTIYFFKVFKDTNYTIVEASFGATDRKLTLVTLNTSNMIVKGWGYTSIWKASGYLAPDQY